MIEQQALFEKFLSFLQNDPALPEYIGEAPNAIAPFDPYQMVAEWVALRHEVKQQGKLLQASQTTLQQALKGLQAEKDYLQQQLDDSRKQAVAQTDSKTLWRDLLSVMDALDQANAHWQDQMNTLVHPQQPDPKPRPFWQKWLQPELHPTQVSSDPSVRDVLVSNQQGIELIRRSLLDILRQHQVIPMAAQGQPFDPKIMYAIGRQENTTVPENTVIQEVVRGYLWQGQVLREAQVIVAIGRT